MCYRSMKAYGVELSHSVAVHSLVQTPDSLEWLVDAELNYNREGGARSHFSPHISQPQDEPRQSGSQLRGVNSNLLQRRAIVI